MLLLEVPVMRITEPKTDKDRAVADNTSIDFDKESIKSI